MAMTLNNLAVSAGHRGEHETAWALFEQALALRTEIGELRYMGMTHNNLGVAAYSQGDYERALPHLEEAVRLSTEIDCPLTTAASRQSLGNCLRERGEVEAAREHYRYALDTFVMAGDRIDLCGLFEDVSMLSVHARPAEAFQLLGAATALRGAMGSPRLAEEQAQLDDRMRAARDRLGPVATQQLAIGGGMSLEAGADLCRALCQAHS